MQIYNKSFTCKHFFLFFFENRVLRNMFLNNICNSQATNNQSFNHLITE